MISVKVPNLQSTTREHQIKPEMQQLNFFSIFQLDVGELDDQEILLNGSMVIKKEPDPEVNAASLQTLHGRYLCFTVTPLGVSWICVLFHRR